MANSVSAIPQSKKRIGFIDAMRGMTMFLVVVAHVMTFGLGINEEKSVLGSVLITFRMPVFFLISGFVAYKSLEKYTSSFYLATLWKKILILLLPTAVFFSLLYFLRGHNPITEFLSNGFVEYWFMMVLLEIFLIYLTINFLCRSLKLNEKIVDITLLILVCVAWYLYFNKFFYINTGTRRIFSVGKLVNYFQFFVLGTFFRKYWTQIYGFMKKDWVKTLAIVLFTAVMLVIWNTKWTSANILRYKILHDEVVRYLGLAVFFLLFMNAETYFETDKKFSHLLKFIGERTMDIYLIHYFFLPDIKFLHDVFATNGNIALEIALVTVMSSLIIAVSLGVSYILRQSNFLGHYLFGAKRN